MLQKLKHSYLVVPLAVIAIILLTFINSKLTNSEVEKSVYIKLALFVGALTGFVVFLNSPDSGITGDSDSIMKGPAPF